MTTEKPEPRDEQRGNWGGPHRLTCGPLKSSLTPSPGSDLIDAGHNAPDNLVRGQVGVGLHHVGFGIPNYIKHPMHFSIFPHFSKEKCCPLSTFFFLLKKRQISSFLFFLFYFIFLFFIKKFKTALYLCQINRFLLLFLKYKK